MQKEKDNLFRLITCGSCSLNETQNRYATIELECLAIQYGISKCCFYLQGFCFELQEIRWQAIHLQIQRHQICASWQQTNCSPTWSYPLFAKNLHSAHVGLDRTMSLTKPLFFWHSMLNDITTIIDSCRACQLYVPSPKRKTIVSRPLKEASFSFKECAADLISLNISGYIVLVDRLTGFLCCDKLTSTSTASVLIKLTNLVSIYLDGLKSFALMAAHNSDLNLTNFARIFSFITNFCRHIILNQMVWQKLLSKTQRHY